MLNYLSSNNLFCKTTNSLSEFCPDAETVDSFSVLFVGFCRVFKNKVTEQKERKQERQKEVKEEEEEWGRMGFQQSLIERVPPISPSLPLSPSPHPSVTPPPSLLPPKGMRVAIAVGHQLLEALC